MKQLGSVLKDQESQKTQGCVRMHASNKNKFFRKSLTSLKILCNISTLNKLLFAAS